MNSEIKLKIGGITCKSCEMLIADAVKELPGIKSIGFSGGKMATIQYDDSKVSMNKIREIIKKEGYKVEE